MKPKSKSTCFRIEGKIPSHPFPSEPDKIQGGITQ